MPEPDSQAPSSPKSSNIRFRPYASTQHNVVKGRYITSNDPRGYIPVYEYSLNSQWIMMDIDDGYVLWTGIWKALGNSKADIVKIVDSNPELSSVIRRVRGGYLKIQGTWMPYDAAKDLARRVAWPIRHDLVPLFGPSFPNSCLSPEQPGYGQVVAPKSRRRGRRPEANFVGNHAYPILNSRPAESSWSSRKAPSLLSVDVPRYRPYEPPRMNNGQSSSGRRASCEHIRTIVPSNMSEARPAPFHYQGSSHHSPQEPSRLSLPRLSISSSTTSSGQEYEDHVNLAPLRTPSNGTPSPSTPYALPPVSSLEELRGVDVHDAAAVLRRLKASVDSPTVLDELKSHEPLSPKVREVLGRCQRDFLLPD